MDVTDQQLSTLNLTRAEWDELDETTQESLLIEPDASEHVEFTDEDLAAAEKIAGKDDEPKEPAKEPAKDGEGAKAAAKPDDAKGEPGEKEKKEEPAASPPPAAPEDTDRADPAPEVVDHTDKLAQLAEQRKANKTQQADIEARLAKLEAEYEDGAHTGPEYAKLNRALTKEAAKLDREDAQLAAREEVLRNDMAADQRANQRALANAWRAAQRDFMDEGDNGTLYSHKDLGERATEELNAQIRALTTEKNKGHSFGWFLRQANARVRAVMAKEIEGAGLSKPAKPGAPAPAAAPPPPAREPNLKGVPDTLGKVPNADQETGEGEFAHLDRLSGAKLIAAIERMTPDQRERYEALQ